LGGGGARLLECKNCLSEKTTTKIALLNNFLSKGVARYVRRFFTEYSNEEPCRRRFPNFRPARPPETETAQFCEWLIANCDLVVQLVQSDYSATKKVMGATRVGAEPSSQASPRTRGRSTGRHARTNPRVSCPSHSKALSSRSQHARLWGTRRRLEQEPKLIP
jgi:hypothetical protein